MAAARPSRAIKGFIMAAGAVAAVLAFTSPASAQVVVQLAGTGAGTVTSTPAGIECSNSGGGSSCSAEFANEASIELAAAPGSGFTFSSWSADDPFGFAFGANSCNTGNANPCDVANFSSSTVHVTATFGCVAPTAPVVTTGGASTGGSFALERLQGSIDPEGCGLEGSYFEYGPSTEYGLTTRTEPASAGIGRDSAPVPVSAETEPLQPETTYHYRLVAVGPAGTSRGEDRTFTTGSAATGSCSNEAIRREQGIAALLLPDCMALEMVTPPQKSNLPANHPNVSADGSRVSFISQAALGDSPGGLPAGFNPTYVASRGVSGWVSESTIPGNDFETFWEQGTSSPSFTPDFSRWFGFAASSPQDQRGIGQAYEAGLGRFFKPLSAPLVPLTSSLNQPNLSGVVRFSEFRGASADHSHFFFRPGASATYMPGDQPGSTYLARTDPDGQMVLELLQRDRTGKSWGGACGARLGGIGPLSGSAPNGLRNQGTISADGSRTYLSARASQPEGTSCDETANKLRILERVETPSGPQISPLFASECSRPPSEPCSGANGDDLYQGASLDQTKIYFTTNRQLTNSDRDGSGAGCATEVAVAGCDLYLYDRTRPAGERLIQVSAGEDVAGEHEEGKEADVYNGITAISADGSHVYFVAAGVLTNHSDPAGNGAQAGEPNLYLWDLEDEEATFVGTLAAPLGPSDPGDEIISVREEEGNGLWGGRGTWSNNAYPVPILAPSEQAGNRGEEGGDGHVLVFESRAELTPNDGDGRHLDVYRYDAEAPSLECISCAPGSSASKPDEAPLDVDPVSSHGTESPPGTDFAESHRWVSEDGEEVGFITPEPLLPGDVNESKNFYLWRNGPLFNLPGKPLGEENIVQPGLPHQDGPVLSHDGSTVAWATASPLLPQDGDQTGDIYVARIDGGYVTPPASNPCEPGNASNECRQPQAAPSASQAASEAAGPGNPPHRRACPKGKVRRHGRCVPRHRAKRRKGHHRRHRARHANTDRRAPK
jgi:hypothetical protein